MNFKVVILIISTLVLNSYKSTCQVFSEDFESGTSSISSTSATYCNSGTDYFDVGDDSDFSVNFTGNSTNFFAAQDIDGCGSNSSSETISWSGININGCSGLSFSIDVAEDDDGSNQDWDGSDFVHIDYSIDGAAYQNLIWFESSSTGTNTEPRLDTDFNGIGDGTIVTDNFETFTAGITGSGSTLEIRITFSFNSGDEDIAIDNIIITGTGCSPPPATETDCTDGIDNDGDGQIDCADGDCAADPACTVSGSSCTYELELVDDYGDGWNGNSINVTINGSTTTYTVLDPPGTQNIINLNVNDGDVISIQYDNSGSYDYENEITLTDGNGDILFQDGQSGGTPSTAIQTFTVDCSTTPGGGSGCTGGTLGPVGGSCGCLSGCDLTSLGGPNCSPSVAGNCTSQNLSVDIPVPDGCTYIVVAEFQPRTGCSASGADGSDYILVDEVGGSKTETYGGGDASIADNFTLVGPGTIRVSGLANRADEIITYTISSSGATCVDCMSTLPIDLKEFNATPNGETVDLTWATASEINNDYFTLEKSKDGYNFEELAIVKAIGNSSSIFNYKKVDVKPHIGLSYYRLKQTDLNGDYTYSDIKSVFFEGKDYFTVFPNPAKNKFTLKGENLENAQIVITNSVGQLVKITSQFAYGEYTFDTSNLSNGHYLIRVIFEGNTVVKKLVITK